MAVGITEPNPNFLFPETVRGVAAPFGRWRDELARIRPSYYRLVVDWRALQPTPDARANLEVPQTGCLRALQPCLAWGGMRDQLRAIAARQQEGGWEGVAVVTGTPDWAAQPAGGCERPGTEPRSRPPRTDALPAYRRLVRDVLALARREGARLRWWSPWNEPNHPFFLSPQRPLCAPEAPSNAPGIYVELYQALGEALQAAPGTQRRLLGELAGALSEKEDVTSVQEFIAALPRELVCAAPVWAQHSYAGGNDAVPVVKRALAARGCSETHAIWVTETGIRVGSRDLAGGLEIGAEAVADRDAGCDAVHERLLAWHADPQVTAAFQYTLREDNLFRTGLVSTALDRAFPVLGLWQAWGREARPSPDDPVPAGAVCEDGAG